METQNTKRLETTISYIVDADDFCEENNGLMVLEGIKNVNPDFKITLFTIVGRCSDVFIQHIKRNYDWIDVVPHGFTHDTARETQYWTFKQSLEYLDKIERLGLTKGFKAPGWQISTETYTALADRGYWVADQLYNNGRRPPNIPTYILDSPNKLHFHIGHLGGHNANEIGYSAEKLKSLRGEFKFIKDVIQ